MNYDLFYQKILSNKNIAHKKYSNTIINSKIKSTFNSLSNVLLILVHSRGFEPLTLGAEIRYSIQLNYECSYKNKKAPPKWKGSLGDPSGTRTQDHYIKSVMLYQLS